MAKTLIPLLYSLITRFFGGIGCLMFMLLNSPAWLLTCLPKHQCTMTTVTLSKIVDAHSSRLRINALPAYMTRVIVRVTRPVRSAHTAASLHQEKEAGPVNRCKVRAAIQDLISTASSTALGRSKAEREQVKAQSFNYQRIDLAQAKKDPELFSGLVNTFRNSKIFPVHAVVRLQWE